VHHDDQTVEARPGCSAPAGQPTVDNVPESWLTAVMAIALSAPL
jgi:hypothetical protein